MKRTRLFGVMGLMLAMMLLVTACAAKESKYDMDNAAAPQSEAKYDDTGSSADYGDYMAEEEGAGITSPSTVASGNMDQAQDKIIRRYYLDVETQGFDDLVNTIGTEIKRLEGYVETSQISGKRYYYENQSRRAEIVARIPSNRVEEFVNAIGENANVVDRKEDTENVSLAYIDIESRLEALKIEQERLFEILGKEVSLENIIVLENRLSDIRYELQNYESKLRYYDNMVAFSTVTMSVTEVERITPVTEEKPGVGERIQNGFSDTMYDISEGFKNFFVWFVVNLPYLLIWAVIITIAVIVIRKFYKKQKAAASHRIMPVYGQPNPMNYNAQNQNMPNQNQPHANTNQPQQNQPQANQSQQNQLSQQQDQKSNK